MITLHGQFLVLYRIPPPPFCTSVSHRQQGISIKKERKNLSWLCNCRKKEKNLSCSYFTWNLLCIHFVCYIGPLLPPFWTSSTTSINISIKKGEEESFMIVQIKAKKKNPLCISNCSNRWIFPECCSTESTSQDAKPRVQPGGVHPPFI
jgi:hypothetical protein